MVNCKLKYTKQFHNTNPHCDPNFQITSLRVRIHGTGAPNLICNYKRRPKFVIEIHVTDDCYEAISRNNLAEVCPST
jgi:hypothetical protein